MHELRLVVRLSIEFFERHGFSSSDGKHRFICLFLCRRDLRILITPEQLGFKLTVVEAIPHPAFRAKQTLPSERTNQ